MFVSFLELQTRSVRNHSWVRGRSQPPPGTRSFRSPRAGAPALQASAPVWSASLPASRWLLCTAAWPGSAGSTPEFSGGPPGLALDSLEQLSTLLATKSCLHQPRSLPLSRPLADGSWGGRVQFSQTLQCGEKEEERSSNTVTESLVPALGLSQTGRMSEPVDRSSLSCSPPLSSSLSQLPSSLWRCFSLPLSVLLRK